MRPIIKVEEAIRARNCCQCQEKILRGGLCIKFRAYNICVNLCLDCFYKMKHNAIQEQVLKQVDEVSDSIWNNYKEGDYGD